MIGMTLTGASFFILYAAARVGEAAVSGSDPYASGLARLADHLLRPWSRWES